MVARAPDGRIVVFALRRWAPPSREFRQYLHQGRTGDAVHQRQSLDSRMARMLVAMLAAVATVAAGCGDDDAPGANSTTGEEAAITIDSGDRRRTDWRHGDQEITAAAQEAIGGDARDPAERDRFILEVQVPSIESTVNQIAAPPAPEQEATRIDAMVAEFRRGIEEIKDDPSITSQGNAGIPGLAEATTIARGLGLILHPG